MEYKCQYCNETFVFDKKQQSGAHVINCVMNPNKKNMINRTKYNNFAKPILIMMKNGHN